MFRGITGACRRVSLCVTLSRSFPGKKALYRSTPVLWREIDLESNPFYDKYRVKLQDVVRYELYCMFLMHGAAEM